MKNTALCILLLAISLSNTAMGLFPEIHFPLFVGPESEGSSTTTSHVYNTIPMPIFYDSYDSNYSHSSYHSGPIQRPQTILGNSIAAAFGTAITSFGTLLSAAGFCAIIQALFIKAHYAKYKPENVAFGRLQDSLFGTSVGCIGIIFTIFGANELKESIKRLYQIYHGLPFDEELNNTSQIVS